MDLIGVMTYMLPIVGELFDIAWAPFSSLLLLRMFPATAGSGIDRYALALVGFVEEAAPGLDFVPTWTIAWLWFARIRPAIARRLH